MSRDGWRSLAFGLLCVVQLAVPAVTAVNYQRTATRGEVFKFRCEPVDPADLFRGRYVALGIRERTVTTDLDRTYAAGDRLYVRLLTGEDGFAKLGEASAEPPSEGPYLSARVDRQTGRSVRLEMPFDRYYLAEELAEDADRAYREMTSGGRKDAYVTVRVRDGKAAPEELYLDGLPLREYLARPPAD
jgi:uncharacterized membrane-anchored protein